GAAPENTFYSKPKYLLNSLPNYGAGVTRAPTNVINSSYRIDPIRFLGDRMWFNSAHTDGVFEYASPRAAKEAHHQISGEINSLRSLG
ncbi:MAG TPA: hypothetical protein DCM40_07330, partial [Maribacter sp.]|nr:hypothetical protein [Maribacter sp.]